jgi:hypothetical protein
VWDAVQDREQVWIFHACVSDGPVKDLLDAYYGNRWQGISGGVTVATRALLLLRLVGYLRFDVFGVDSCWLPQTNGLYAHHAFPQEENTRDKCATISVEPMDSSVEPRTFCVSPWQLKQAEDWLQIIRIHGSQFLVNVHGDGLIAHMMRHGGADAQVTVKENV